jgi:hypothetical protein
MAQQKRHGLQAKLGQITQFSRGKRQDRSQKEKRRNQETKHM